MSLVRLENENKELNDSSTEQEMDSETFAQMVESSLTGLKDGEVVVGRVVEVTPMGVLVDIGYKAEGEIPIDEFTDSQGQVSVKPGDEVEVLIESRFVDGEEESVVLSRRRAGEVQAWERIEEAYREDGTVEGTILNRVKGGLRVDVGVPAFLPGSQVDLRPIRDLESLLDQKCDFKVLKYSRRRRNVVLSRRAILEEERQAQKAELLRTLKEDQAVKGVVKNVVKYGAFIDLGGMDGLLHVSDMSWGRIQHPGDLVRVGDELTVKVLKFDQEKERISLGLKQLSPDPWSEAEERYPAGTKIQGQVVNVVDYGAFVEIEPGLEGLIHVSEMSWGNNLRQAGKVLSEGQKVEVVVLSLDTQNRKLALSLKRAEPDPWQTVSERFPPGTVIEGTIKSVTDFGLFIGLEEGVDGLIHRRDITWNSNQPQPEESFETGQTVQAVVLSVDPDKRRVALGLKQLSPDPWPEVAESLSVGSVIKGKVIGLSDQGAFVEVDQGVEGLIKADDDQESDSLNLSQGEEVQVRVVDIQPDRRHLALALVQAGSAGE
ncbi:MAG: 30S ribosomal protein S1 [Deltaproteobacteria bacterium]|nr:30S ribosomal protein S1 [Deltaproteobacteria bacterium]